MTKSQRDFIKEFLTYIQVEKGLARHTLESYGRDLARLEQWSTKSGKTVVELTRADLRKWIAQLSREGLAPTSVARAVSAARGLFRFLMLTVISNAIQLKIWIHRSDSPTCRSF